MRGHDDPVDGALDLLRSAEWTAHESFDPELERKLMGGSDMNRFSSRFARPRTLVFTLVLVAVGGAAFAASGGVEKLRNWFVTVEINGEQTRVELDENGESTFDVETADGGTATVHIQKSASPEDGQLTRVQVTKGPGEGASGDEESEICRQIRLGPRRAQFTTEELGDAQPLAAWSDKSGKDCELYILPDEAGEGSRVLVATMVEDGEPDVRLVATTPFPLVTDTIKPEVSIAEDGLLTLRSADKSGDNVREIKLMLRRSEAAGEGLSDGSDPALRQMVEIGDDGQITIRVSDDEPDD